VWRSQEHSLVQLRQRDQLCLSEVAPPVIRGISVGGDVGTAHPAAQGDLIDGKERTGLAQAVQSHFLFACLHSALPARLKKKTEQPGRDLHALYVQYTDAASRSPVKGVA